MKSTISPSRVTPETAHAWIARAKERTVKHLREEVAAAELLARLTDSPRVPPADEALCELHAIESLVTSGAALQAPIDLECVEFGAGKIAFGSQLVGANARCGRSTAGEPEAERGRAGAGRMSAGAAGGVAAPAGEPGAEQTGAGADRMSAGDMAKALTAVVHAFDASRRLPGRVRYLGRVTLRLRVSEENYWHYRSRERLHRRFGPPGPFLRFLCFSLIGTWRHALRSGVAYEHIYARDRFRCASPVCTRRDVTPHHLTFRSHGAMTASRTSSRCVRGAISRALTAGVCKQPRRPATCIGGSAAPGSW